MYFRAGIGLRAANGVGVRACELLFRKAQKSCDGKGEYKVDDRADNVCGYELRVSTACLLCYEHKLGDCYNAEYRGVLDVNYELVADRGHNVSDRLGQNYVDHSLEVRHTDSVRTLKLSLVDRDDTASYDLRHICTRVERNDDYCGNERGNTHSYEQAVMNYKRLYEHRRAAYNLNVSTEKNVYCLEYYLFPRGCVFAYGNGSYYCYYKTDEKTDKGTGESHNERVLRS